MATQSYIDYETILSTDFTPQAYANRLVLQTNDANDATIDLTTPLSKVLFDAQEIDTHIDSISTQYALPLVQHTKLRSEAGQRVLSEVEAQVSTLSESYDRLAREVGERYEAAAQMQLAAERLVRTVRLGRAVQRALTLGRQLQVQIEDTSSRSMLTGAQTIVELRQLFAATGKGEEAEGIGRVMAVTQLRNEIVPRAEPSLLARAQKTVAQFVMTDLTPAHGPSTFREFEEMRDKTAHALQALYLLSPKHMLDSLETFVNSNITRSINVLVDGLNRLVHLPELMDEIAGRCQNIAALEALLSITKVDDQPLLDPLLTRLNIGRQALSKHFWFQLARNMPSRVDAILATRSNAARTLRSNGDRARAAVREGVRKGGQFPVSGSIFGKKDVKNNDWEQVARVLDNSFRSLDRK